MTKQIDTWKTTAARYDSEPQGTATAARNCARRRKQSEHERDTSLARYHHYEFASAAFQIGIVLASATVITGMMALAPSSRIGLTAAWIHRPAPHVVLHYARRTCRRRKRGVEICSTAPCIRSADASKFEGTPRAAVQSAYRRNRP